MLGGDIAAKGQKTRLYPLNQIRAPGAHIQIFASRKERVPYGFAVFTTLKIKLKPPLMRPTGAGKHHVLSLKINRRVPKKFCFDDILTKNSRGEHIGFGALNRKRRHIGLENVDIQISGSGKTLAVEQHVGIRE